MKTLTKWISMLLVCVLLVCPVMAAEEGDTFVPSISYKDGPPVDNAQMDGKDVTDCIVVTSIIQAREQTTDITQADRDLLLDIYEKLSDGDMKLPLDDNTYVVRELVDVSFKYNDCVSVPHGHKEWLAQEDTSIEITFDLGVQKTTDVVVLVYLEGKWNKVEATNLGDGLIRCVFEDFCPVAFCVDPRAEGETPVTGDIRLLEVMFWSVLMLGSFAAIVVMLISNHKRKLRRQHRHSK